MGLLSLLVAASMPVLQVMIIGLVGAFLASGYSSIFTESARRDMNKVVFAVFTPSLIYASLAKTVTLEDIISWWFMVFNIALTFVIGATLGWIAVKILRPKRHLEGLIMASCSAGNLGNLLLIIVPAICDEGGSQFGETNICRTRSLSYSSLSMALGSFFIWSHTYSLIRKSSLLYKKIQHEDEILNSTCGVSGVAHTIKIEYSEEASDEHKALLPPSTEPTDEEAPKKELSEPLLSVEKLSESKVNLWANIAGTLHMIAEEIVAPPNVAAIIGFIVGVSPWLKSLFIGDTAPLRVIQDSVTLLGDGTVPCITLILGGNLTRGLKQSTLKSSVIISIVCIKYVILPLVGIAIVKAVAGLGFLATDPLYSYVLMIQFTLPPAMNIGTMAQLFDVAQEECSVMFLWTYLAAAPALTLWSTVYLWILS